MPIVNCFIANSCTLVHQDVIEHWSMESGIPKEHMTVNFVACNQQLGNPYAIMANLKLPSVWSKSNITKLQVGLAQALAHCFQRPISDIHVVTSIIDSAMVVENGEVIEW